MRRPGYQVIPISIHALRGEGDKSRSVQARSISISIHALRGEGDQYRTVRLYGTSLHFYPRPPWGGRRGGHNVRDGHWISIHALRGEGDIGTSLDLTALIKFLSTPSVGRATVYVNGDAVKTCDFYPRPPWGGRHPFYLCGLDTYFISIHALRGEGDFGGHRFFAGKGLFLSTPSVGRATKTALNWKACATHFYPRPPWGGRHVGRKKVRNHLHFYPRPPWGGRPG